MKNLRKVNPIIYYPCQDCYILKSKMYLACCSIAVELVCYFSSFVQ